MVNWRDRTPPGGRRRRSAPARDLRPPRGARPRGASPDQRLAGRGRGGDARRDRGAPRRRRVRLRARGPARASPRLARALAPDVVVEDVNKLPLYLPLVWRRAVRAAGAAPVRHDGVPGGGVADGVGGLGRRSGRCRGSTAARRSTRSAGARGTTWWRAASRARRSGSSTRAWMRGTTARRRAWRGRSGRASCTSGGSSVIRRWTRPSPRSRRSGGRGHPTWSCGSPATARTAPASSGWRRRPDRASPFSAT